MPFDPTLADVERKRLGEDERREKNWKRWGPYLSERQWATVREDYSADGDVWNYFPHDHARSRAYRWGEDGLLGICDRECRLCFSVALWNGRDPILKERLFGLTGPQGNHGEDVKECWYYLDSSPTHSYLKALYKYPQAAFPYQPLVDESAKRTRRDPEFELADTGVFDQDRYFDVLVEYAKRSPDHLLIRLTVHNRGPDTAALQVLPTVWFRNTWSWGVSDDMPAEARPSIALQDGQLKLDHPTLGAWRCEAAAPGRWILTENETNYQRISGIKGKTRPVKDAFHDYVVGGDVNAVSQNNQGTKAAAVYQLNLAPGASAELHLRLFSEKEAAGATVEDGFAETFAQRIRETDAFHGSIVPPEMDEAARNVMRQAYASLLWSKQFYHYVVRDWLAGDQTQPTPPAARLTGRNSDWKHLFNRDVISMPDKWEYPWYAAWDLAFHMLPLCRLDPQAAKEQLVLFLREWYMHPSGQLPAYEFALNDVNPPVHAWACWRVYKMTGPRGARDRFFLERVFQKLVINFTWWVNRKDIQGKHIFAGGFLGLDNIGLFDRSKPLPQGQTLEQADGTAWMAFYCGNMLSMALELASEDPVFEDVASKFFEHLIEITEAINTVGGTGLWDETDGFYYDLLQVDGQNVPLRIRSLVGIIPLFAALNIEQEVIAKLPNFEKRMRWFMENRKDLARFIIHADSPDPKNGGRFLLAIPSKKKLLRVLKYLLDENEFLSPHGIRSVSKYHQDHPYGCTITGQALSVRYSPGESTTDLFGGNSNWRGPIWFPLNYLLVEALERYHHYFGDDLKVECPTGSGKMLTLLEVARELSARLAGLFLPDAAGRRPCFGDDPRYRDDPNWKSLLLFNEYFHGDDGHGLGASHQTGWTALVTHLLESLYKPAAYD